MTGKGTFFYSKQKVIIICDNTVVDKRYRIRAEVFKMDIFILLSVVLLFMGFYQITKQGKENLNSGRIFMIVSFVSLIILSGCRGLTVGTDTPMFVRGFSKVDGLADINVYENRFELGYRIFQCILAEISEDPHFLLFVSSLVTIVFLYILFYKYSDIPWYSVFVFVFMMFYYNSMCLIRQYLAISLTCMAFTFLIEKKYAKFIVLSILAGLFHTSAFVFLIILPISFIPLKKKNRFYFIGAAIAAALLIERLMRVLIRLVPKYAGYLKSENYFLQNKLGSFLNAAVFLLFFIVIDYIYAKYPSDDERTKLEYWVALIGFAIKLASIQGWIFSRVGTYFTIICCISLPNALSKLKSRNDKYIFASVILFCCIAYNMVIFFFRPYWSGVIPYYFWNQLP